MTTAAPCQSVRRRAFTLVETVLAMALGVLVSMAVVMMLGGTASALSVRHNSRTETVSGQVAQSRLAGLVRGSAQVLAVSDAEAVLWVGDRVGNGLPNVSELRYIAWNAMSHEVWVYESTDGVAEGFDQAYSHSEDWLDVVKSLVGSGLLDERLLLRGVQAFEMSWAIDASQPTQGVVMRMKLSEAADGHAVVVAASCRVHR